jgi:NitT/TauT family transport system substrate-binding protein
MLASVGLGEGEDYETVLLDGFDPLVHIELDGIVGFPGYKSNEPGQLERAGVDFDLFAPSDHGIPGSFGVLYTAREFLEEHPTAAQDFLRASMRGLADAMADPAAAAAAAIERVEAGGNPNFLSLEGETFRWTTDVELLRADTPDGTGVGVPDAELLQAEVDAYAEVGLFAGGAPDITDRFAVDPIAGVYDDTGAVIWPGS